MTKKRSLCKTNLQKKPHLLHNASNLRFSVSTPDLCPPEKRQSVARWFAVLCCNSQCKIRYFWLSLSAPDISHICISIIDSEACWLLVAGLQVPLHHSYTQLTLDMIIPDEILVLPLKIPHKISKFHPTNRILSESG